MRRVLQVVGSLSLALSIVGAPAAMAQGFFESLFGGGPPRHEPSAPQMSPMPGYGYRAPIHSPQRDRSEARSQDNERDGSGRYRTLCVRMCDGYYYPISNATARSGFYKDAGICRSSCGSEARLFYHDRKEPDVNDMVDLTGRAYAKLSTAFLYRKKQVDGCKCKPEPWSQSELDRHRSYALQHAQDKGDGGDAAGKVPRRFAAGPSDPAVRAVFDRAARGDDKSDGRFREGQDNAGESSQSVDVRTSPDPISDPEAAASTTSAPSPPTADRRQPVPPASRRSSQRAHYLRPEPVRAPVPPRLGSSPPQGGFGLGVSPKLRWPGE